MTRKHKCVFFLILSVAVVCFIFSNSLQSRAESKAKSELVAALLNPILNPHGHLTADDFHTIIRKLAHFIEYGLLGICLVGVSINWYNKKMWIWITPAWTAFFVAVTDEIIQHFTGRACMFIDVLIDLSGAVCSILFAAITIRLWRVCKMKQGGNDK